MHISLYLSCRYEQFLRNEKKLETYFLIINTSNNIITSFKVS